MLVCWNLESGYSECRLFSRSWTRAIVVARVYAPGGSKPTRAASRGVAIKSRLALAPVLWNMYATHLTISTTLLRAYVFLLCNA